MLAVGTKVRTQYGIGYVVEAYHKACYVELTNGKIYRLAYDEVSKVVVERRFYKVDGAPEDTMLPKRATKFSAGYDFYAPCDITVPEYGDSGLIFLNVKAQMLPDEYLQLIIRSSLAVKRNLTLETSGVIDADYFSNEDNDGNIGIKLRNHAGEFVYIRKGERICQGIFMKYLLTDDDDVDGERTGGYGSSGK